MAQHPPSVLVIGESIMDLIDAHDVITQSPGGSAANVALGLARLGVDVEFLTALARDEYGLAIVSHLEASGVRIAAASFAAPRTSTATATLDSQGHARYRFDVDWSLRPPALETAPDLLHAGSIAAFSRPDGDILRDTMSRMAGREVTFDPNIRPDLMQDHSSEIGVFEETAALATAIKLSDEDAAWLYPDLIPAEVTHRLIGLGPNVVVLTLGAEGSLIVGPEFELQIPAGSPRQLVDTIGAGDTYMATMIRFLLANDSAALTAEKATQMGETCARAAAITVSRRGADLPTLSELEGPAATA